MDLPDRVPKERYFDPDFYELESSSSGPGSWQMACRLEEIPEPRDFVEYQFLDQSIIVRAHRRHGCAGVPEHVPPPGRAARRGRGHVRARVHAARSTGGATAPTARTPAITRRADVRRAQPRARRTSTSRRSAARRGAAARGSTSTTDAPPVRECLEPAATSSTRGRWSRCGRRSGTRARLPVNWKLAHRGVRRDVPRGADAPAARHPDAVQAPARARRSTRRPSSTPTSSTCAR